MLAAIVDIMQRENNGIWYGSVIITSYLTMHTHLHANQLNKFKGFNASVGTMNCGCVMS